ncbi:RagB/SusD family nutrient uptake outer membrane protein [Kriegella aquimaris]|uniref:Starch-binding associating with outer membrane n=1 Tax=Kriegella aquimaris TaxID=192904 RepID=A0A1G9XVJ8_9FLAO|nr:RagB/SusD family nutrient uptake outer membrane protein [Kriegella aquimaris]SDN00794.1 Starch-binding associating with outer membrane [Kriegella aquimaris]
MKTLTRTIFILTFIGLIASCNNDFMDRYPPDKINEANYWKTLGDLETYSNQFYAELSTSGNWQADNMTDNQGPANRNAFIWNEYVIPSTGGGWGKNDWATIRSCNFFLTHFQTVEGDAELINTYVGEVRFFRAWNYYGKVKQFGDVPWIDEELNVDSGELNIPRTSRNVVVDSIVADLDFAISNLPETSSENRLTKYAALALKSRICLYEGTWQKYHGLGDFEDLLRKSVEASTEIIDSGNFQIYNTGNPDEDYYNLFIIDELSGNSEAIMIKQYSENLLMSNRVRQLGESGSGFTKDFALTYLSNDGLPIANSTEYQGDNVNDYMQEFENRDPRMKQSIYTPDQPYHITSDGEVQNQEAPQFDNGLCFTGYRIYKQFSPTQRDFEYQRCTLDEFIFRYGEVLLNYAEAKAELGEIDQSDLDLSVNKLRERVNMPSMTLDVGFVDPNWPNWEVPVSDLINEIRRERRVELAAEGFRFDDLMRWKAGKLLEGPNSFLGALDPDTEEYRVLYPGLTRTWDDKLYLYPVPIQEITLNPNLTQNPGWSE